MKLSKHDNNTALLFSILVISIYRPMVSLAAPTTDNNDPYERSPATTAIPIETTTPAIRTLPPTITTTTRSITSTTTTTSAATIISTTSSINTSTAPTPIQHPHCTLGDDTFQIGERWNPNLPPFGVQVCVLCECTIRQRKSCYESKVTCRRITNECPVIDSCPDGSRPTTIPGQCCKSCQSNVTSTTPATLIQGAQDGQQQQLINSQSVAYEQASSTSHRPQQAPIVPFKFVYMNERTKDYLSMVKNLPSCPVREAEKQQTTTSTGAASSPKTSKASNKNDLNGIDIRLAFKSLHDTGPNYLTNSPSNTNSRSRDPDHSNQETTVNPANERPGQFEDSLRQDHQHPNDVQSAAGSVNSNNQHNRAHDIPNYHYRQQQHSSSNNNAQSANTATQRETSRSSSSNQAGQSTNQQQTNSCQLGNDTFQVGDIWNPVLPPFGVQVCVLCSCNFRLRRGCFETRLTCRRINRECPSIDVCPDGLPPVTVTGQCCKSCPQTMEQSSLVRYSNNNNLDNNNNNTQSMIINTQDGLQRNEKVYREFQAISKNLSACVKRSGIDIYNNNNSNGNRYTNSATSKRFHR